MFRCICCPKPKPSTEENKFALVLEKLESIEKAVKHDTDVHDEAEGGESTVDEGVIVTFEKEKDGSNDGLRKRKEFQTDITANEKSNEIHGFSKYFNVN